MCRDDNGRAGLDCCLLQKLVSGTAGILFEVSLRRDLAPSYNAPHAEVLGQSPYEFRVCVARLPSQAMVEMCGDQFVLDLFSFAKLHQREQQRYRIGSARNS